MVTGTWIEQGFVSWVILCFFFFFLKKRVRATCLLSTESTIFRNNFCLVITIIQIGVHFFGKTWRTKLFRFLIWDNKINSQLHNYGFKRTTCDDVQDKWIFSHPNFIKQREDLLTKVVRISNTKQSSINNNSNKITKRRLTTTLAATKSPKISASTVNTPSTSLSIVQILHEKMDRCLRNQEQILQEQQRIVRQVAEHEAECASTRARGSSLSDWLVMKFLFFKLLYKPVLIDRIYSRCIILSLQINFSSPTTSF